METGPKESTTTPEWIFYEEEALSFCDLPLGRSDETSKEPMLPTSDDFEFASWPAIFLPDFGEMCVADDVISGGQLLPFRPSVSSGNGLLASAERVGNLSRSESLGRSWCFTSSRDESSSSRSSGLFDSALERRGSSTSSSGLLMGSPKPGMTRGFFPAVVVGRRKEGATKMGLFRLGLMRTPEIQLGDLRQRLKRKEEMGRSRSGSSSSSSSSPSSPSSWKVFRQLDCKCSAIDTISASITRRKAEARGVREGEEEESRIRLLKEKSETSRLRTFEWLNELPCAERA